MKNVKFTEMKDGDKEDYELLAKFEDKYIEGTAERVIRILKKLDSSLGGYQVSRLEHSSQTASRALREKASEEMIVAALLHDIGDTIASANHADLAATMLEPFVSEENYWIVKHHGIFQGYYFFEYLGLDKNMRDEYRDSPYWHACAEFCAKYDQNSFDPEYENMSLEEFEPMVRNVFSKPKNSIYKKRDYA